MFFGNATFALMKLLIIDNNDSFTFNLVQIIEEWGKCRYDIIKPLQAPELETIGYDKVLISPGPGIPSEYEYFNRFISENYKEKPILGVCLGHQALGVFFGARLIHAPEIFHGKFSETTINQSIFSGVLYRGIPSPFRAGRYHSWILDPHSFPDSLEVTAHTDDGIIMSFSHKTYPVNGVQFHPESYMTRQGRRIIQNWLEY